MPSPTSKKPNLRRAEAGATTTDDFLGGRIGVLQPKGGHRAGSDAVFLAAAVPARAGMRVLDVGAGVGVAGLCVLARVPSAELTAIEIDARLCALAAKNAERNGFGDKVECRQCRRDRAGEIAPRRGSAERKLRSGDCQPALPCGGQGKSGTRSRAGSGARHEPGGPCRMGPLFCRHGRAEGAADPDPPPRLSWRVAAPARRPLRRHRRLSAVPQAGRARHPHHRAGREGEPCRAQSLAGHRPARG